MQIDVSLDVDLILTANSRSPVSTKFVKILATSLDPVVTTVSAKQSIMTGFVHVYLNSLEIPRLCVKESNLLPNVLLTMNVSWDKFVLPKDVSLDVEHLQTALKNLPVFATSVSMLVQRQEPVEGEQLVLLPIMSLSVPVQVDSEEILTSNVEKSLPSVVSMTSVEMRRSA